MSSSMSPGRSGGMNVGQPTPGTSASKEGQVPSTDPAPHRGPSTNEQMPFPGGNRSRPGEDRK